MNRWKSSHAATEWTRAASNRRRRRRSKLVQVLIGAVALGLAGGKVWQLRTAPTAARTSPVIEWNSVQGVPTRKPDAADIAWERRSAEVDDASAVETQAQGASFGYCFTGGGLNCVVDGDTFYFNGEKVRIAGIDAPETHPPRCDYEARLGSEATEKLHALLNSGAVTMTSIERDRDVYGRLLRNVQVDGDDVGETMIAAGVARAYGSGRKPWC